MQSVVVKKPTGHKRT